jgi:hypothetical protein
METSSRFCAYNESIWIGFGLMGFALLRIPMDPKDFLALALSAPWKTIQGNYGIQEVVLFWISVALIFLGLIGCICSRKIFQASMLLGIRSRPNIQGANSRKIQTNRLFLPMSLPIWRSGRNKYRLTLYAKK